MVHIPVSPNKWTVKRIRHNRQIRSTVHSNMLLAMCTAMALHCDTFLHVGVTNTAYDHITQMNWWSIIDRGCGCAKWCSASGDKRFGIQEAQGIHDEFFKSRKRSFLNCADKRM